MDAEQALAEVGKVNERLRELDAMLHRAVRNPASQAAVPLLQQQIADAIGHKEWLLGQIQRMEKAAS